MSVTRFSNLLCDLAALDVGSFVYATADQADKTVLGSVEEVRALNAETLTGAHIHARITGVITWVDGTRTLFLQDSYGGIQVEQPRAEGKLAKGQRIEVTVSVTRTWPYPSMAAAAIQVLDATLSPPSGEPIRGHDLDSLRWQYRFVHLDGIIRADNVGHADQTPFTLYVSGRNINLTVRDSATSDYFRLVDARVGVAGVLCVNVDAAGRPVSSELKVQNPNDLQVLEEAHVPAWIRSSQNRFSLRRSS